MGNTILTRANHNFSNKTFIVICLIYMSGWNLETHGRGYNDVFDSS